MNNGNDFGRQLRIARTRRGATQRQLADLSTISVRAIRDLETGRAHRPRPDTVRLIADGLGLSGRARTVFEDSARTGADVDPYGEPPPVLDSVLGRDHAAAALTGLLVGGEQRLVTVVGVGGVGKTALATHVAAALHGSGALRVGWLTAADAPDEPSVDVVQAYWPDGPGLLVLDGCHPDPDLAERLVAVLARCPSLRVLLTARAPLGLAGEHTFPLAPLATAPGPAAEPPPALALLLRYVRQVRPGFDPDRSELAALTDLCANLDGIPSALRSAAEWLLVFEPADVLDQVGADPFAVVGLELAGLELAGAGLRGDPREQALLHALAEIDGPWSIADAVATTGAPFAFCHRFVHRLVVLGVVGLTRHPDGPRFRLLRLARASCRTRLAQAN